MARAGRDRVTREIQHTAKVVASNDPTMPAGTMGTMTTRFVTRPDGSLYLVQRFERQVPSEGKSDEREGSAP